MISFLKQKDSNKWYIYHSGKVLATCQIAAPNLPLIDFTKHATNMLPSTVSLMAKGFELIRNIPNCGEVAKMTLATDGETPNSLKLVEIDKSFILKFVNKNEIKMTPSVFEAVPVNPIKGKGVVPLEEEDYWKLV